tara:strand:- start:43 stop:444 length:402 start_codon:yes stop_codon:yes gene_type:complete
MTATFQGVGTLQFTPDNKRAFAYSGDILAPTAGSYSRLIQFETQSYYLVAKFNFGGEPSTINVGFLIKLDGIDIIEIPTREPYDMMYNVDLIIPPFTTVEVLADPDGTDLTVQTTMVAEVYGPIEQFDLEVKE